MEIFRCLEQLTRPKMSRGCDWGKPIRVLVRHGDKEMWKVAGVAHRGQYSPGSVLLVTNAEENYHDYRGDVIHFVGRLVPAFFRRHAATIDKFFGIDGLAAQLDPANTLIVSSGSSAKVRNPEPPVQRSSGRKMSQPLPPPSSASD